MAKSLLSELLREKSWLKQLLQPASIYPVVALRVMFGLALCWWSLQMLASGAVYSLYISPGFLFHFPGLSWLKPLPGYGMYIVFTAIFLCSLLISLGWFFRIATSLFVILFTYISFIDRTVSLSYHYLIILLGIMLAVSPAHRMFSLDLLRKPLLRVDYIPLWFLKAIKLQVAMVFFFAGMAKLEADWLFQGRPVSVWLSDLASRFGFSYDFSADSVWISVLISWAWILSDFILPHFLLDVRTSKKAFLYVLLTQVFIFLLFPAGFFPMLLIMVCVVFLPSKGIHELISRISYFLNDLFGFNGDVFKEGRSFMIQYRNKGVFLVFFSVYLGLQVLLPVGLFLSWGSEKWADSAFHISWNMHLNEREGKISFYRINQNQNFEELQLEQILTPHQVQSMTENPVLIGQFVSYLSKKMGSPESDASEIRADLDVSFNGREPVRIIDKQKPLFSQLEEVAN